MSEGEGEVWVRRLGRVSRNVLLLGLTSLIQDVSSELIQAVLPGFIAALGGGGLGVGLIGGLEESAKSLLSIFSGHWSDRFGRRKPLVAAGYALANLAKLGQAFVGGWGQLLGLRLLDRVGKGLRTAPRDALIADSAAKAVRGLNFGLHRAMDSLGAVLGTISAYLLYHYLALDLRQIILLGGLIGLGALLPLIGVRERPGTPRLRSLLLGLRGLSPAFWLNLSAMMLFAMANLSYMFFWLKASQTFPERLSIELPILMYALFNLSYTALSLPAGAIGDRLGRRAVLLGGYLLFIPIASGFIFAASLGAFIPLFLALGAVYALVEGNQRALAADLAAREGRGLALGVFHMGIGLAALLGGAIAGAIWEFASPAAAFTYGSAVALAAALLVACSGRARPRPVA
ncbi:MAG: MFS transporter [Candidatus Acetothermia bacterium]|jgi:MFS family permease|nr:MFS transporter [Candidatus Acetothermia bacterium]MDH7505628.1 MFS transporter [Candidatus Acetothermia bacterium]